MAARVQTVSVNTAASTSLSVVVTLPTSTVAGDLLVAWHTSTWSRCQLPSGFTDILEMIGAEANFARASYIVADSTLITAGSVTMNQSSTGAGGAMIGRLFRITGQAAASIIGTPTSSQSSGTTVTPATITFGSINDCVLAFGSSQAADTWTGAAADAGATVTEKADSTSTNVSSSGYEITRATAGATGTITLTRSSSTSDANGVAFLVSAPVGPANLKSYDGNVKANLKSMNGNLIANIKSFDGNS